MVPTDVGKGKSNQKSQYKFKFGKVFERDVSQTEVFDEVGKRMCDSFIEVVCADSLTLQAVVDSHLGCC